jgi:hypothetical protein
MTAHLVVWVKRHRMHCFQDAAYDKKACAIARN